MTVPALGGDADPATDTDTPIDKGPDPVKNGNTLWDTSVDFYKGGNDLKVKLNAALKQVKLDASNSNALAQYQAALSAYTLYRQAQSNTTKAIKDVAQSTIQNLR